MSIACCLLVDGAAEIERFDNSRRTQIKRAADYVGELCVVELACAEAVDKNRDRARNADGIRYLNLQGVGETCRNHVFSCISGCVAGAAVYLSRVLAGECAAAVMSVAAVGIYDYFTACQTGVPMRAADYEAPRRVNEYSRLVVQHIGGHSGFDNCFNDSVVYIFLRRLGDVLRGDYDCVYADGLSIVVFYRNLALSVGEKERQFAGFAD